MYLQVSVSACMGICEYVYVCVPWSVFVICVCVYIYIYITRTYGSTYVSMYVCVCV